jgi:hypothetical protein
MAFTQNTSPDSALANYVRANYAALEDDFPGLPDGYGGHEDFEDRFGQRPHRQLFVNAYEVTQGYGGAEEGGWWYDCGEPIASIPVRSEAEAFAAIERLTEFCVDRYGDERPYYSAAGGYDARIQVETRFARPFPTERPHYE